MTTPLSKALRLLTELLKERRIPATVHAGAVGILVCVPNREGERAVEGLTRSGFKGHAVQIERTGLIGTRR